MTADHLMPGAEEIESEFRVLDEEYDRKAFYGGAFEGSHYYGEAVVLRLYSVVPGETGDRLRIETRHHHGGDVVDHLRSDRPLTEDRIVEGTEMSLPEYCRQHHLDAPQEELRELLRKVDNHSGREGRN